MGSNPPGGGGPQRGISFKFEYLGEFKFIFETALRYESRGQETCFDEKNCMQKISRYCSFNGYDSRGGRVTLCAEALSRESLLKSNVDEVLTDNSLQK
jgi:hypothetical protein